MADRTKLWSPCLKICRRMGLRPPIGVRVIAVHNPTAKRSCVAKEKLTVGADYSRPFVLACYLVGPSPSTQVPIMYHTTFTTTNTSTARETCQRHMKLWNPVYHRSRYIMSHIQLRWHGEFLHTSALDAAKPDSSVPMYMYLGVAVLPCGI